MALTFKPDNLRQGGQQLVVSGDDLPQFLLDAKVAIESGRIEDAKRLLNDEAVDAFTRTLADDPSQTEVMFVLGLMFGRIGLRHEAEKWYQKVLQIEPNAHAFYELGRICRSTNRTAQASEYAQKAREIEPGNTLFQISFALDNIREGETQEGVKLLRKIVEQEPGNVDAHSKLLFHMHFLPDLHQPMFFEEHKRWGEIHAPLSRARTAHDNIPDPDRRLRVGYLSPDFRSHATVYNFAPLVEAHDRDTVEIFGYANVAKPDSFTEYLRHKFDHFRNVSAMSDKDLAALIERDKIDIMVVIGGHVGGNRLLALARKPAPVQVDYGGLNTTGMEQIDYRITDNLLDLPQLRSFYTEESVCLPGGVYCYRPPDFAPPVEPPAAKRNGYVTFGSFSNSLKINPHVLRLWAEVLKANDGSAFLMKFKEGGDRTMRDYYLSRFKQLGIDPERIQIHGWKHPVEHMQLYSQVDIALDTYPFNGCMTTLEGLWMGVPTISLVGDDNWLSRSGLTILSRLGLEFFAASTPKEYVTKATALARNVEGLEKIRLSMRSRMGASSICDADRFAREMEAAYRKMWQKWCKTQRTDTAGEKCAAGPDSKQTEDGVLEFFISKNSSLQLSVSKATLPSFLLKAGDAVKVGKVSEAEALLDDQAVETVRQMADNDPGRTDALFMLAVIFAKIGQVEKAEQFYKEVLRHRPHPLVLFELANICRDTGRLSEAIRYQQQAVEISPDSQELWTTLAEYLIRMGQTQQGIDLLRKTVATSPDTVNHSKFLWHLHQSPQFDQDMLFEEHKRWARIHAPAPLARVSHDNAADPGRRLRIGYISPDFCGHSVAYFFESILDGHDRNAVDVYGYGDIACPDQVTERLEGKFDHYRNICGLGDKNIVRLIDQDKIDILVDLAGHTSGNRLGVLAYKPAPVQVTYLGFPDTTGMSQIDYRLTDELADLPEARNFHTEELVFLPHGFLCYKPPGFAPPVTELPAIESGVFTFGSFNNNCKIQPHIMELWARILKSTEKSRLLLKFGGGDDEAVREHYFGRLENLGISRQRVEICGRKPIIEHFKLYGRMDIALDTHPYNGTTTTCEAMWMGVPTISLVGDAHASRVGLSILSRVGLADFAASTLEEYVAKAVAFSSEIDNLAKIRTSLRAMMFNSPLCDKQGFTRSLEDAYRKMWHKWCRNRSNEIGADTRSFSVEKEKQI